MHKLEFMLTIQSTFQLKLPHLPIEIETDRLFPQIALQNNFGSAHCYQNPGC